MGTGLSRFFNSGSKLLWARKFKATSYATELLISHPTKGKQGKKPYIQTLHLKIQSKDDGSIAF